MENHLVHRYLIISGVPGAGKSRLGRTLAAALDWPLLSKDTIKEALADSLGMGDETWSLRLSMAAMEVLHRVALASTSAVLDANFKRPSDLDWLAALPGRKVQLFCHAPPDVIGERLLTRAASGHRHPIHRDVMHPERMAEEVKVLSFSSAPLDLGIPTLSVDTSFPTDEGILLDWIKESLGVD